MHVLPNNCRAGKFSIFPPNWKSNKADINCTWRISYWFHDDNLKQKKQVVIKTMNSYGTTLIERQQATKVLIDDEMHEIKEKGFNKITGIYCAEIDSEVSEYTPFIEALEWALQAKKTEPDTKIDMACMLKFLKPAAVSLNYDRIPIGQIRRKHLKQLLEKCGKLKVQTDIPIGKTGRTRKGIWSANQYNHYRKYLSALYTELVDIEVMDANPVTVIKKERQETKIRDTLTKEQRLQINKLLFDNYYSFWRFLQIFFHSGARIIELLRVQKVQVDLEKQRYKVLVKKGKKFREEWRTIKTIALPLWQEVMNIAMADDYLFSQGLMPGKRMIRREQVTTRWKRHVKDKLHITADFYSLKHTNLDEVAEILNLSEAQKMAGHSTPVITMTYAVGEQERKHDRLKNVSNTF